MVFVGYGIVAPEFDHNDYADVDVRGKVVVFLGGEPPSEDPEYFGGEEPSVYSSVETKQRIALSRGAVGSVLLPPTTRVRSGGPDCGRSYSFEHLTPRLRRSAAPVSLMLHPRLAPMLFSDALFDFEQARGQMQRDTRAAQPSTCR